MLSNIQVERSPHYNAFKYLNLIHPEKTQIINSAVNVILKTNVGMIFYLIYISKAKRLMQEDELVALLNESRNWNNDHGLTGMLLYVEGRFIEQNEGRFMQVLEGDERQVKSIFEKIKTDVRHFHIIVLDTGTQPERIFSNWTMGFKMIDLESLKQVPGYFGLTGDALSSHQNEHARPMLFLKSFYNTNEEFASTYPDSKL